MLQVVNYTVLTISVSYTLHIKYYSFQLIPAEFLPLYDMVGSEHRRLFKKQWLVEMKNLAAHTYQGPPNAGQETRQSLVLTIVDAYVKNYP